jgi:O-antigen ligase
VLVVSAIVVVALASVVDRLPGASLSRFALLQSVLDASAPTDTSAAARGDLFAVAAQQFAERPLFGNGTGSFATWAQTHVGFTDFTYPHNDLMQFAAELGIIGAGIFAGFLIVAFGRRLPQTPGWQAIYALALFMVINGLVSGDVYGDRLMWGLLVLLVAAPARIAPDGGPDRSEIVQPDYASLGVRKPTLA